MNAEQSGKVMVNGRVRLSSSPAQPVDVRRGMCLLGKGGAQLGVVAGVVVDEHDEVTHILLGCVPVTSGYRLVPPALVTHIAAETIQLCISFEGVVKLPLHRPC